MSKATVSYVAALCIYGTIGLLLRRIGLPSELVAVCRAAIGSLFIAVVVFAVRRSFDAAGVRANIRLLVLSGACLGLNWMLLFAAYRATTVAVASLCNYMAPLIMVLVAPLLGERRSAAKVACVAVAFAGMVLVSGVVDGGAGGANVAGVALGLGAALGFVAMVVCNKRMGEVDAYSKSLVQLLVAAVTVLPFVLVLDHGMALEPDATSIVLVVVMGVVHTGVAYCLYFSALARLEVQVIAVLGYVEPAVAVLCSVFLLGEPLTALGWLGTALIFGAAVASELSGRR